MRKIILSIACMLFCTASYSQSLMFTRIQDSPGQLVAEAMIEAVYKKLNIDFEYVFTPGKRGLIKSSKGELDGELLRGYNAGEAYPTLVRVPTSFFDMETFVFSKKLNFTVSGWSSLRGYKIAIIRGETTTEDGLRGVDNVMFVDGVAPLLKVLDLGRVDVIVTSRVSGLYAIKNLNMDSIYPLYPAVNTQPVYHYLHEKHKHLIPKIDSVVRSLKESGELNRIRENILTDLMK